MPESKTKKKRTMAWSDYEKNMLSYGLKKFYDELNKLTGMDYTDRFLKAIEFFKSKTMRHEMRHMFDFDIKTLPKEWKLKIANARNDKEIEKIIEQYELLKAAGKDPA